MNKIGSIIYAYPELAIMYLGGDDYLFGEKVVTVPSFHRVIAKIKTTKVIFPRAFMFGVLWSMIACVNHNSLRGVLLDEWSAKGYACGMTLLPKDQRLKSWTWLQRNIDNLFTIHPYIEQLMFATDANSNLEMTMMFGQLETWSQELARENSHDE